MTETAAVGTDPTVGPTVRAAAETRLGTSGAVAWAQFGSPIAVSGDLMLVGAPGEPLIGPDIYGGAAYVFLRDPATDAWTEQVQLVPDDTDEFFRFGSAVAIDGETAAASVPSGLRSGVSQEGGVYVFGRDVGGPDQWGAVARVSDPIVETGGDLGTSITVVGDLMFVGATTSAGEGMVIVFERDRGGTGAWGKVTSILESDVGDSGSGDELFGSAVAVDGDDLLIGAPPALVTFGGANDGSAYFFRRDPVDRDRWSFVARLAGLNTGADDDGFGAPIALQGDTAVVGASAAEAADGDSRAGTVYVFRRDAGDADRWNQVDRVTTSESHQFDDFGAAIALAGDTLLVGAPEKPVGFNFDQGAAFVFRRDGASSDIWKEVQKLTASDGAGNDNFGQAVALHDDTAIIGSPRREGDGEPDGTHDFGGVYLYDIAEPPPVECQPATAPTDTLVDGGAIIRPSGVSLSAPAGTLPRPLSVWLEEVATPAESMDPTETPVGSFYDIGARCTASAMPGMSFVLEFPVPVGVDTARLSVSVLMPADHMLDGPGSGLVWDAAPGTYDAARNVYATTVSELATEGMTFVLVEVASPEGAAASVTRSPEGPEGVDDADDCEGTPQFQVECKIALSLCPVEAFTAELVAAYQTYSGQHFPEPRLKKEGCAHTRISVYPVDHVGCERDVESELAERSGARYVPALPSLRLCIDPLAPLPPDKLRRTVRHELFHAFQHGFDSLHPVNAEGVEVEPPKADKWIREGMAEAAVESSTTMHRVIDERVPLRDVGTSLIAPAGIETYAAQDFWVHLFTAIVDDQPRAYPLAHFADFLSAGAKTANIVDVMRHPPSSRYRELGEEYWAWAKNQVFEKDVTFDGALANPCTLDRQRIGSPLRLSHPSASGVSEVEGEFDAPLQTRWVVIKFRRAARAVVIQADGDNLAYKVYQASDAPNCRTIKDDDSRFRSNLARGSELLVLVANKSTTTFGRFKVSVFEE